MFLPACSKSFPIPSDVLQPVNIVNARTTATLKDLMIRCLGSFVAMLMFPFLSIRLKNLRLKYRSDHVPDDFEGEGDDIADKGDSLSDDTRRSR